MFVMLTVCSNFHVLGDCNWLTDRIVKYVKHIFTLCSRTKDNDLELIVWFLFLDSIAGAVAGICLEDCSSGKEKPKKKRCDNCRKRVGLTGVLGYDMFHLDISLIWSFLLPYLIEWHDRQSSFLACIMPNGDNLQSDRFWAIERFLDFSPSRQQVIWGHPSRYLVVQERSVS